MAVAREIEEREHMQQQQSSSSLSTARRKLFDDNDGLTLTFEDCYQAIVDSDVDGNKSLTEEEFVQFVSMMSNMNQQNGEQTSSSFDTLPNALQLVFWDLGGIPIGDDMTVTNFMGPTCRRVAQHVGINLVLAKDTNFDATALPSIDRCLAAMVISDFDRNQFLDQDEYLEFVNELGYAPPATAFISLEPNLQSAFYNLAGDTVVDGISIDGARKHVSSLPLEQLCETVGQMILDILTGADETPEPTPSPTPPGPTLGPTSEPTLVPTSKLSTRNPVLLLEPTTTNNNAVTTTPAVVIEEPSSSTGSPQAPTITTAIPPGRPTPIFTPTVSKPASPIIIATPAASPIDERAVNPLPPRPTITEPGSNAPISAIPTASPGNESATKSPAAIPTPKAPSTGPPTLTGQTNAPALGNTSKPTTANLPEGPTQAPVTLAPTITARPSFSFFAPDSPSRPPPFDQCYRAMVESDLDNNLSLDKDEFAFFSLAISDDRLPPEYFATFEGLGELLQKTFFDYDSAGGISVDGAQEGQDVSPFQILFLDSLCLDTAQAIDFIVNPDFTAPPSSLPKLSPFHQCYEIMAQSDLDADENIDEYEYVIFAKLLSSNRLDQEVFADFADIDDRLQVTYVYFERNGIGIPIQGAVDGGSGGDADEAFLDLVCFEVARTIDLILNPLTPNQAPTVFTIPPSITKTPALAVISPPIESPTVAGGGGPSISSVPPLLPSASPAPSISRSPTWLPTQFPSSEPTSGPTGFPTFLLTSAPSPSGISPALIAGAVIGGVVCILLMSVVRGWFLYRSQSKKERRANTNATARMPPEPTATGTPYQSYSGEASASDSIYTSESADGLNHEVN